MSNSPSKVKGMINGSKIIKKIAKIPVLIFYRLLILINPVDKRMIIFESNLGRNYSGNPRFIYEEMVRRGLDREYSCYYILEDLSIAIPGNVKKVKRKSFLYFMVFAKAGFWVSDTRMPAYLVKRKKTLYIQTWHGTPLKRLALDMFDVQMEGEKGIEDYKKKFVQNVRTWDYLLSQNRYSTEIFRRAFDFKKEILEFGYPRNDILINDNNFATIKTIKKALNLPLDKKIILYAPTWRDNEHYGPQQYRFNTPMDYDYLKERLGEDYVVIVKAHYLVSENLDFEKYKDFYYLFTSSFDIAELYLIADVLITDYSSVMFDYSILQRPMIFYAYDLEDYKDKLRGFYFDFVNEAPGPIVTTTKELVEEIENYDYTKYKQKYEAFISKFNHTDKGDASKKVVDLITSHGGTID